MNLVKLFPYLHKGKIKSEGVNISALLYLAAALLVVFGWLRWAGTSLGGAGGVDKPATMPALSTVVLYPTQDVFGVYRASPSPSLAAPIISPPLVVLSPVTPPLAPSVTPSPAPSVTPTAYWLAQHRATYAYLVATLYALTPSPVPTYHVINRCLGVVCS